MKRGSPCTNDKPEIALVNAFTLERGNISVITAKSTTLLLATFPPTNGAGFCKIEWIEISCFSASSPTNLRI